MTQVKTERRLWDRVVDLSNSQRAGYGLFGATSIGFVVITILVATNTSWLIEMDESVQERVFELRSAWSNDTMLWITRLGSRWVIGSALLVLTFWVVRTGRCRKALTVMVIAFLANPFLEMVLKAAVGRDRPALSQLVPGNGPAFPSGHVLATVGFYGVLAAVIWRSSERRWIRIGGYGAATIVILSVGLSRIFLGVHWFSDVVGGMLVGTAFVLAVAWSLRGHHLGGGIGCEVGDSEPSESSVVGRHQFGN